VWDGLARNEHTENAAQVLLELAHGAAHAGEFERAERAADRSARAARERGEAKVLLSAEAVVESARRSRAARTRTESPARAAVHEESDAFAADLARSLHASLVSR
jgi:hypothetical protein